MLRTLPKGYFTRELVNIFLSFVTLLSLLSILLLLPILPFLLLLPFAPLAAECSNKRLPYRSHGINLKVVSTILIISHSAQYVNMLFMHLTEKSHFAFAVGKYRIFLGIVFKFVFAAVSEAELCDGRKFSFQCFH